MTNRISDNLHIGHVNIRSLLPSMDYVRDIVSNLKIDLLGISESWLTADISSVNVSINDFTFYRADRMGRGGGVGIYVRNCFEVNVVEHKIVEDAFEHIWITIKINSVLLGVGVFYRPPRFNALQALDILESSIADIIPLCDEIILMGDLNIDLLSHNNLTESFERLIGSFSFNQVVNNPTRYLKEKNSLLDVIILSGVDLLQGSVEHCAMHDNSDHDLIHCKLNLKVPCSKAKIVQFRDYRHFDQALFESDLLKWDWNAMWNIQDVDQMVKALVENMTAIFNIHAPVRTVRVTRPKSPWFTDNLKLLKQYRNRLFSKYKKSRSLQDWETYKEIRNFFTQSLRNEKKAYIEYISRTNNSKQIWSTLNDMNVYRKKKNTSELPSHLKDPSRINDFFVESVKQISPGINIRTLNSYKSNKFTQAEFTFKHINDNDVYTAVRDLKSNAFGADNISPDMIRLCCPQIVPYLTHIFNSCVAQSWFPAQWKEAIVIPLPKVQSPHEFSDLRPISILSTLSKIFERILNRQMTKYLLDNSLIPRCQSGFRTDYSTTSALVKVLDDLVCDVDQGKTAALMLLDFSKAFDVLNHQLLCAKLEYYGFSRQVVMFFQNYLLGRSQRVRVDGRLSRSLELYSGVPQGSIFGPLLFIIFTLDMCNCVVDCGFHQYADDTQIYTSFSKNNAGVTRGRINESLDSLCLYSSNNGLKINPNKSAIMYFGPNKEWASQNMRVSMNGVELKVVTEYKNLGVIFDSNLRFRSQVSKTMQKCYISLRNLYKSKDILDQKLKKNLSESLVLSNCNYGSIVYFSFLDVASKHKLQKIQNSCIRFIFGLRVGDHVSHRLRELRWLNIEARATLHLACFVWKALQNGTPSYICEKLHPRDTIHNKCTRYSSFFDIPKHRTALFQRCFSYVAPKLYNAHLSDRFNSMTLPAFRNMFKKYYM